ncbi:hypothetical protein ABPG75_003308 [Micractinium tetrahymenae]
MAGSGIRSMRYLLQAGADYVLCNEGDLANAACLVANLAAAAEALAAGAGARVDSCAAPSGGRQWRLQGGPAGAGGAGPPLSELVHEDAVSLLARCHLEGRFFDLIDLDSFGGAAHFVGASLDAVRYGGLVCLTSTSGTIAGGRDPASALALYGQHLAPVPHANEQGLRMLIGLAHREALARRLSVTPLWSLYSPHGSVFRTMLLVDRQRRQKKSGGWAEGSRCYGYTLHWPGSGESACCAFQDLPAALQDACCSGGSGSSGGPPLLSGPLWLGPLHDHGHLQLVQQEAAARGWVPQAAEAAAGAAAAGAASSSGGSGGSSSGPALPATRKGSIGSLQLLLDLLVEEAAAEAEGERALAATATAGEAAAAAGQAAGGQAAAQGLPPWFLRTNDVGRAGQLARPPARDALLAELRRRGFLACRSHVDPSAVKTTASLAQAVEAAVEGLGIPSRAAEAAGRQRLRGRHRRPQPSDTGGAGASNLNVALP